MIKILAIGDPHSKKSNQNEIRELAVRASGEITSKKPKAVVILGDLANDHEKIYLSALNGIVYFLETICKAAAAIGSKVYYIIGNHDCCNNQHFLEDSHAFNAFKGWSNLIVVDRVIRLQSPDGPITMCPYVPPGRFVEALDTIGRDKWTESMVIFCHQEFKGAQFGYVHSQIGYDWEKDMPMVVSGHIHGYQAIGENVLYVGAPYDISFGDEGDKTISLLSFEAGKLVLHERIDLKLPRKITLHMTIEEAKAFEPEEGSNTRLYITGTTQEFAKFKKTEHFLDLTKKVKIIPQITDPVKTARNVGRKGYLDILREACCKENALVIEMLGEVMSDETNPK